MTTKITTKKFQLVSKYANYQMLDEKQNAPLFFKLNLKLLCFKKLYLILPLFLTITLKYVICKKIRN